MPEPKGSTSSFPFRKSDGSLGVSTRSANPRLGEWQHLVASGAERWMLEHKEATPGGRLELFDDAVTLRLVFSLPRPVSLPKKVVAHTKRPDLDKLVRAVKDALSRVVWRDDAQVVEIQATKGYGLPVGVLVTVSPADVQQPVERCRMAKAGLFPVETEPF